ncbi:MAG: DUF4097 family beta strand repeat-containing protein [Bacillota bacterium]
MNKSTNDVDIDKFKVDKKTQIKVVILCLVTGVVCGLMAVWLFGNGSSAPVSFEFDEDITSIVLVQDTDGVNSKATRSDITFVEGDSFSVYSDSVNGKEELACEVVDGVLTITLDTAKNMLPDFFSSDKSTITITVPAGTELDSTIIKADLAYINIDSLDLGYFELVADEVVMYVFDSDMEETKIVNNIGNIYMYDSNLGTFTFNGGTTNPEFKYCTFGTFDVYIQFGNLFVDDSTIADVNLTADMGYVDMTNITLEGNLYTYADYGAVVLSLVGNAEDFILDAYIMESGKYYLDETLAEGSDSTLQQLTIATYIGDIDVSFVG